MTQADSDRHPVSWPRKNSLFGLDVSATTSEEAIDAILEAARHKIPAVVSHHSVHAVVTAVRDPVLLEAANSFEMIAPDGHPVRWALNLLHDTDLRRRVTGPDLMLELCSRAAAEDVSIYLYGSSPKVIEKLQHNLRDRFPALRIAGAVSPPFRDLSDEEDEEMVGRINRSGAGIVFVGLGYPKQDRFAYEHRGRIQPVQVCVGAAFDFLSGHKRRAPEWMQRWGLEWLYRLLQEPRRLWHRYLVANSIFLAKLARELLSRRS